MKGLQAEPDGGYAFFCKGVPTTLESYNGSRDISSLLATKVRTATSQELIRAVRIAKGLVVVLKGPVKPFRLFRSLPSVHIKDRI